MVAGLGVPIFRVFTVVILVLSPWRVTFIFLSYINSIYTISVFSCISLPDIILNKVRLFV